MGKEIWALVIKTSLPETAESTLDLPLEVKVFENFEEAKQSLRKKLKEYAFAENSIFDGNGGLNYFCTYQDEEDLDDEEFLAYEKLKCIQDLLKGIFEGKDASLQTKEVETGLVDYVVVDVSNDTLSINGEDDGDDSTIKTNMFDMTEEKDYYLYIVDVLSQYEGPSVLYIDLVKTKLE